MSWIPTAPRGELLVLALLGTTSMLGCVVDETQEQQQLRVDYCLDVLPAPEPGPNGCWCTGCINRSPAEGTTVPECVDDAQPSPSVEIKDESDAVIGTVTLYYSPLCGAIWATTESHQGDATVGIASFLFESDAPDAGLLPQTGVLNVTREGGYTRWSTLMQASTAVAVACGWIEVVQEDGTISQYGACTAGDHGYINHPPVCTEATADPGTIFQSDDEGHARQQVTIGGVYDPDGDDFTMSIPSIFQNQPTNDTGDGNTCQDADGNNIDDVWVRLERRGNDAFCRRYQIEVTAQDEHGAICAESGFPRVDVTHDVSGHRLWTQGQSPCALTPFVQEYDSAGACF